MTELFPVPADFAKNALIDEKTYQEWYDRSVNDPEGFWGEHGKRVDWIKPFTQVKDVSYKGDVSIKWFADGTLNVAANCLDAIWRPVATRPPSSGKATTRTNPSTSPTASCTPRSAVCPT